MGNMLGSAARPMTGARAEEQGLVGEAFALACEALYRGATTSARRELQLLQRLACDFGRLSHATGHPPERMLVLLKRSVHDSNASLLPTDQLRGLQSDVVRWAIEGYYQVA